MRAAVDDPAPIEDQDTVGALHRGKAVRDDDGAQAIEPDEPIESIEPDEAIEAADPTDTALRKDRTLPALRAERAEYGLRQEAMEAMATLKQSPALYGVRAARWGSSGAEPHPAT